MRNFLKLLSTLLFTSVVISCTKTITPVLNSAPAQIVIEGAVSDTAGPYHINISSTINFYANNVYPTISGAEVSILDSNSKMLDFLTETSPGIYTTHNLIGIPGDTYALKVQLNGKFYTASSTMPRPIVLDSISFDYSKSNNIRPIVYFQDPLEFNNYYNYTVQINGKRLDRIQTFKDYLSNGKYIRENIDTDTLNIHRNDVVTVSVNGLDHPVYNFLKEAEEVAYNNSNLSAPANPTSNISGGCIGYFSAQTVRSKTRKVK